MAEDKEKLLKYGWAEFLKTPFSLLFCILCVVVYFMSEQTKEDKYRYEQELKRCNEERLKDRSLYIELLNNLNKRDSIKKIK